MYDYLYKNKNVGNDKLSIKEIFDKARGDGKLEDFTTHQWLFVQDVEKVLKRLEDEEDQIEYLQYSYTPLYNLVAEYKKLNTDAFREEC